MKRLSSLLGTTAGVLLTIVMVPVSFLLMASLAAIPVVIALSVLGVFADDGQETAPQWDRETCDTVAKSILMSGECCFSGDEFACEAHDKIDQAMGLGSTGPCGDFEIDVGIFAERCSR